MFQVGQKVVRVGSKTIGGHTLRVRNFTYPKIGEVCTVATINHWPYGTIVTLREHDNSHLIRHEHNRSGYEPGFDARAFRPLVERKTDISIFTKMLDSKEKIMARE